MHPREQIALIMQRIYNRGLTTTSGGNISIIDESGDIWITPTGVDKGLLNPSDVIYIKQDGTILGNHKPSSELPFHQAIYNARPNIKSIIHAHPPALVSFSIVQKIPNTNVLPEARQVCGEIGYAKYEMPGTAELGKSIADEFAKGYSAIIMENHGTVVGGKDLSDTYQRLETLEMSARTIIYGNMVGELNYLSDNEIKEFEEQIPELMAENERVIYSDEEREKRFQICKIVHRACQQELMSSSYGTVSVRLKRNDFLITSENVPRWDLQIDDIVQIKDGKREKGKIPSKMTYLHKAIYNAHPEINTIILTQAPYLMSFTVTDANFNVRTIPETWIYLQDVQKLDFGSQFQSSNKINNAISSENPMVLVKNHCVLVAGNKLLQTFDYLEVAEFSAKSLVMSTTIGKMVPINDERVEAIGKVMAKWKNYEWSM